MRQHANEGIVRGHVRPFPSSSSCRSGESRSGCGKGRIWNVREMTRAAFTQTFAECWQLYGKPDVKGYCGMHMWTSEEADESEGLRYSVDEDRWNGSRLLQEQDILLIPDSGIAGLVVAFVSVLLAAVRSQCRLMKIGMSEKARKR